MAKGMRRMQGTRRMFTRIPGNLLEDSRECSYFSIPGNPQEDSGECSRKFRRMLLNIPGGEGGGGGGGGWDVGWRDSGECSRRFRGI